MQKAILSFTICTAVLFTACQKKDNTQPDPQKVTMSIASPAAEQTIHTGDTLRMDADVSYISELHGYEITLSDTAGHIYFSDDQHVHSDHFSIHETWPDTLNQNTRLMLQLTVEIDHNGNEATKTVYINSMH
jgi:hypothetical protein